MLRRAVLFILVLLLSGIGLASAQDGNWPGWRGDGTGISAETGLPVDFDAEGERLWTTELEGSGHSSPVVWGDRLYLTNAGGAGSSLLTEDALRWLAAFLGLIVVAAMVAAAVRFARAGNLAGHPRAEGPAWFRAVTGLERLGAMVVSGYFLWLLWDLFTEQAVTFSLDAPHLTWIYTGEVVVYGAIAAVAALWVRSIPRLLALLAFGAWVAMFHYWQPRQAANLAVPTEWQMNVLRAAAWAGAWFVLMAVLSRVAGFRRRAGGWSTAAVVWPLGLVAVVVATFGFYNYVQQSSGLWRSVVAMDANTGEVLWQEGVGAPLGRKYPTNSFATPTPVTDGEYVVANFGPVLLALDRDGDIVWQKEEPLFVSWGRHGAGASPVIHGDTVIHVFYPEIQEAGTQVPDWSHQEHSYIRALDLETGEELWRTGPIEGGHDAFTTPVLLDTADGTVALLSVMNHVQAYDADTGEHLWGYEEPMHVPVPSPVAGDGAVFAGGGLYGPTLVLAISLDERGMAETRGDGQVKTRWSKTRGTPEVSSPILYRGLLYWITQNGRMFAADPATGEIVARARLSAPVNASPTAAEGRLYIPSTDGKVLVVEAGPELRVLAENEFDEGFFASPAIADGRIYLRTTENTVIAIAGAD